MQFRFSARSTALMAAAAVLAVAVAGVPQSVASSNARAGHYAQSKSNVIVATFDVVGGKVKKFSHNDNCTRYPLQFPEFKSANGHFSFTGDQVKDLNSQEWSVRISGKAVSSTVITGSASYKKTKGNAPCETTTKFRVKRTGKARSY